MGNRLMGPVDTIWLNMDRPDNLMIIDCLMFFEGPVDWSRVTALMKRRLVDRYPVFRQRPVQPRAHVLPPHWEDDPDFDLDRHARRATLERPDDDALQEYVERLMSVPFDRDHPLWEMHLIDGYHAGSVVYSRIHHSLADGIALNQVLLSLTDETPEGDLAEEPGNGPEAQAGGRAETAAEPEAITESDAVQEAKEWLDGVEGLDLPAGTGARRTTGATGKPEGPQRSGAEAADEAADEAEDEAASEAASEGSLAAGLLGGAVRLASGTISTVFGAAAGGARLALGLPRLLNPRVLGEALVQAERTGAIAGKLLLGPRPQAPLGGKPATAKRAVWSEPFPLADIKHLGRRTGTTVNDVLMGAVAGALSTYMKEHGSEPHDVSTMVPVNVRPLDRPLPKELGNQFALVLFKYPAGLGTPIERLVETHRRMEIIKHSPEVLLTFGLIKAIGRTGPELERFFVDFFAGKAIGVTTNVPGPRQERYIAGSKINSVLSWVPGSGEQTVGVAIYTYSGNVRVGFKTDAERIPDPEHLVHAFSAEIDGLRRLAQAV